MTRGDAETAASAFVEAVQKVGTAQALVDIDAQVTARERERMARHFDQQTGSWTAREVAQAIRGLR